MIVVAIILLLVAVCWPTFVLLHGTWTGSEGAAWSHGYLIAAVVAYRLWLAGAAGPAPRGSQRWWPLGLLFLAGLAWVLAVRAGIAALEFLLLPVLLFLAIRAAAGPEVARRSLFPTCFLYFALPVWGKAGWLLQWMTVYATRGLLRLAGIPAYFDENFVSIPAGTFEIAGGCSGLHFFIVALAVAALTGELRRDSLRIRARLLLVAGLLAVATNWLRVFTIILAGHYSNMQHYLVTHSHYGYGWVLFAVAMVVFFLIERRMQATAPQSDSIPSAPAAAGKVRAVMPVFCAAAVLGLVAMLQWLSARPAENTPRPPPGWVAVPSGDWSPRVEGADVRRAYVAMDGGGVEVRQFLFLNQEQGKELGGYSNDLAGGDLVVASHRTRIGHVPVTWLETRDSSGERWLVAASYAVGTRTYATPIAAQVCYAAQSLLRLRSVISSLTLWRAACNPDCRAAQRTLEGTIRSGISAEEPRS